jgi:hypothetical protein
MMEAKVVGLTVVEFRTSLTLVIVPIRKIRGEGFSHVPVNPQEAIGQVEHGSSSVGNWHRIQGLMTLATS